MDTLRSKHTEVAGFTQRVRDLESCVERLSERIDVLEKGVRTDLVPRSLPVDTPRADALSAPSLPSATTTTSAEPGWITLTGRTFLVLAGAFFLRALTDSGRLPTASGVWIGLAYAALWLALSIRRGGRSGGVHGLTALIIALPLIFEAAIRFHVLGPRTSALVIGAVTLTALGGAWRRRLVVLAVAALVGGVATALAVAVALGAFQAPTLALVILGIAACWVADDRDWPILAWPAAIAADLAVMLLALRASVAPPQDAPLAALATHALLGIGYLGTFLWQTRGSRRDVGPFEVTQTTAVLLIVLADAIIIAQAQGLDGRLIALPALVFGAALYGQAFIRVLPTRGAGGQFYYVGMTALVLSLTGVTMFFAGPVRPMALAGIAVLASILAARRNQPLLALHGSITGVASAVAGGLIPLASAVWLTHVTQWPVPDRVLVIVLAALLAAVLLTRALRHEQPSAIAFAARLALAMTLVSGVGCVVVIMIGPPLAGTPPDPGMLATIKTVILVLATLGVAAGSRIPRFGELTWLTYGLLGVGALKILGEDFPSSSPSTLFVALAAYGAALIVVPKIVKRG